MDGEDARRALPARFFCAAGSGFLAFFAKCARPGPFLQENASGKKDFFGPILDRSGMGGYNFLYKKAERTVLTCPRMRGGSIVPVFIPDCGARSSWTARFFILEVLVIGKQELLINEEIRDKEIRVIDSDGSQLGILSAREAMQIAAEKNLDLVKIAPQATPPVCRIMDYGKYRFEQAKREKEAKKNQHVIETKEVRLSLNIDTNDFNTKLNRAKKFLEDGDKVKLSLRFRGREMTHTELGADLVRKFLDECAELGATDKPAKLEGRSLVVTINSKIQK
jgi:translation initiation factor IF-3